MSGDGRTTRRSWWLMATLGVAGFGTLLPAATPPGRLPIESDELCPGEVGLCSRGIAATLDWFDVARQHAAGSSSRQDWNFAAAADPCRTPQATCGKPVAARGVLPMSIAGGVPATTARIPVREHLRAWVAASAHRPAPLESAGPRRAPIDTQEWLQRSSGELLSAHATAIAAEFLGPVTLAQLEANYLWAASLPQPGSLELQAIPRDDMTRLFCREIRVVLGEHAQVQSLSIVDQSGTAYGVLLTDVGVEEEPIGVAVVETAALQEVLHAVLTDAELPPSPRPDGASPPLIRFAAATIEVVDEDPAAVVPVPLPEK